MEITMANSNLEQRVAALEAQVAELQKTLEGIKPRDRGPASTREMTDEDAYRVMFGDLKDSKTKAAAEALGLSYAQVYSARGGYTFKHVAKAGVKA